MENNPFQTRHVNIESNDLLRTPQRASYARLAALSEDPEGPREVGIVLPVGCGKSGCITLAPFALKAMRTLVVAPNVNIAQQLHDEFNPSNPGMFYQKCRVLCDPPFPEPVEIRGRTTNRADLEEADVVITNIQQLQGEDNRWLQTLLPDFFDLIIFDEAHHNVATSWELLRNRFPRARVLNFSATPMRADGQVMAGQIIYSYPIFQAIDEGYVKHLKAIVLNPTTLRYVRREDGREIEVSLEEVYRLGEEDADFRRSIVTSTETLNTIVSASIRELDRIRALTGDQRHKIIASALNYQHCIQIVEAYRSRSRRADYVHSREDSTANTRVIDRLNNHELDVIVQVRKLGEGFDHPYLSVAAVFSIFRELSPFVQFVGRIMRVIVQNDPGNRLNQGTVIFHAGGNVARRWEDFQRFSQADQDYFDQLLPLEDLDFDSADEIAIEPFQPSGPREAEVEISSQEYVLMHEIPLLAANHELMQAFELLRTRGVTPEMYRRAVELQPVPTTRVRERQAARAALDDRIRNEVGRVLHGRGINPMGRELDLTRRGRTNFVTMKAAIDRRVYLLVGRSAGERSDYSREELNRIDIEFGRIVREAIEEVFPNA